MIFHHPEWSWRTLTDLGLPLMDLKVLSCSFIIWKELADLDPQLGIQGPRVESYCFSLSWPGQKTDSICSFFSGPGQGNNPLLDVLTIYNTVRVSLRSIDIHTAAFGLVLQNCSSNFLARHCEHCDQPANQIKDEKFTGIYRNAILENENDMQWALRTLSCLSTVKRPSWSVPSADNMPVGNADLHPQHPPSL